MDVRIDHFLKPDDVAVVDGVVYCGSLSGLLAQIERERRRADAAAAFLSVPISDIGSKTDTKENE